MNELYKSDTEAAQELTNKFKALKKEIAQVIIGQEAIIDKLLIALFCKGHVLLVGVPGLAKTLLISTVSQTLKLNFSRIQFTPDLMPGDILGTEILEIDKESGNRYFKFVHGPIFTNMLLADEINRTPPKTQAALLEAMQENKVTIAGQQHLLSQPFFVLATQNPIEQEGTYPLPEAQLDRFMFNLVLDYPSFQEEVNIVKATTTLNQPQVSSVLNAAEIIAFQQLVRKVPVPDNVIEYSVRLVNKTRKGNSEAPAWVSDLILWGAGPRASQYLILGAKAHAVLHGRYSPDIEDVKAVALPVLRHRIVPSFNAEADAISADELVRRLLV
ncbi:MAG: MoxR family ATPase [Bacteroidia bacterium]|nr:MoxR family ATPase [Bacteroidia bacterium]